MKYRTIAWVVVFMFLLSWKTGTVSAAAGASVSSGDVEFGNMGIALLSADMSYTDANGNIFTYVLDDEGKATIKAIWSAGSALAIPDEIEGAEVVAVKNGTDCVVSNTATKIPNLTINCKTVGVGAFSGLHIGTLTIGEQVGVFSVYYPSTFNYYWRQFEASVIDKLVYEAVEIPIAIPSGANTNNNFTGPFNGAQIGELEFGENVELIPEFLFRGAKMTLDKVTINAERIGAYAFAGSNISIGVLTLGENVKFLEECSDEMPVDHVWFNFASANIGVLKLNAADIRLGHRKDVSASYRFYAPFYGAKVGRLEIGEGVARIPEFFLKDAVMNMSDLTINVPEIGAFAFWSENISFDTLVIGTDVEQFTEAYFTTSNYHYWMQFAYCKIGHLIYEAEEAVTINQVCEMGVLSTSVYPPFSNAEIGSLTISEDVRCIPDYLLCLAKLSMDELVLDMPVIGANAFLSENISIGSLTIGEGVTTFSKAPHSTSSKARWQQFANATITELHYQTAVELEGFEAGNMDYFSPFYGSHVGTLYLGNDLQEIPPFTFANMYLQQEELELHVKSVGGGAFNGSTIKIGVLTLGEEIESFPRLYFNTLNYFWQFNQGNIGTLRLLSPHIITASSCFKGPFEGCTINRLEIGETAEAVPDFMFLNAKLVPEELTLENIAVGHKAFSSATNKFPILNIGDGVTYTGTVANEMYCFKDTNIGTLNYNGSGTTPLWSSTSAAYGMFAKAIIGQLNIGEKVERIPAAWFREATMRQTELTVPCGWTFYAFYSSNIKINRLNLTGDFPTMSYCSYNNYGFYGNTIGTVYYDIPAAQFSAPVASGGGPFYNAKVTNFIIGEDVVYLDDGLLRKSTFTNCYVYAVGASGDFKKQALNASYLPSCTNLYVHYNSDFRDYFSRNAGDVSWLCMDYLDEISREKVYRAETEEYVTEILNECSVCGYEIITEEPLDDSYEIFLSLPVGIGLVYDPDEEVYSGSGAIFAYGTLGNAYENVRISVDTEAEGYGTAKRAAAAGEEPAVINIRNCLTARFRAGDAVFTLQELTGNKDTADGGGTELPYGKQLQVSVLGVAFLESGPGDYEIPIALKVTLTK